jgi:hypothetical protein
MSEFLKRIKEFFVRPISSLPYEYIDWEVRELRQVINYEHQFLSSTSLDILEWLIASKVSKSLDSRTKTSTESMENANE